MLAAMADIVFLVDESGSEQNTHTQDWLATIVDDLAARLQADQIDVRYGLVGFGEGLPPEGETSRFAHTQLLGPTGSKDEWTTSEAELISAINNDLAELGTGPSEDGWDAVEHAIAEYDFRDKAVPMVVLVQGDQGRTILNETLTRPGILAALQSKNVILNSIVAGELLADGEPPSGAVLEPLGFVRKLVFRSKCSLSQTSAV